MNNILWYFETQNIEKKMVGGNDREREVLCGEKNGAERDKT